MVAPSTALLDRLRGLTLHLAGPGARERLAKLRPAETEYRVDPYGLDIDYATAVAAPFLWLYRKYFRVQVFGLERVPAAGRVLLVANHSGQLPVDAVMIGMALLFEKDPPRLVRALVEKWVPTLPFISPLSARIGAVVGTPENCRRLLAADEGILVFPEGVRGLNKPFSRRYRLQEFGTGFVRLALEAGAPIVPVGVVGAEEQSPAIANLSSVARLLSMPSLPLTPTLLPVPLPTRYRIHFGEPLRFTGSPDDEDAVVEEKVRTVKAAIQKLLDDGVRQRPHVFW
jgi:1-acyl-sn-glycerol-3-phosphate acyltransferase